MVIRTTRFGTLEIQSHDIIRFPEGLFGLQDCQHWVLLADAENDALGWLQSASRPDLALAVVSPRRFVPTYQLRVGRSELNRLSITDPKTAHILAIVGKNERGITLNLKAPLVIHLEERLGRQVINNGNEPIQYQLHSEPAPLRKSA